MKRLLFLLVFITAISCSVFAADNIVTFSIESHDPDFMKIQKSVQNRIDEGFIPLGITDYNDKLYFLYLSDNVMKIESWMLSRYATLEEMDTNIAERIADGYFPAGYTSFKANFYVLFIESGYKASYYKVKDSEIDSKKLELEFAPFLRTGTIPMDLDIIEDKQIYLSAQMKNLPGLEWKQESFDFNSDKLQEEIMDVMKQRFFPWGLDITDGILRISFIKFK